jgi:hypothetical protein
VLLEGRVRRTAYALAPKHLPDGLVFLDILDEITFSKPVRDGFKRHSRRLAQRVIPVRGIREGRTQVTDL